MSRGYFQLLAEYRLLREDLDVDAIAYAFQATFEGFLQAEAAAVPDQNKRPSSGCCR